MKKLSVKLSFLLLIFASCDKASSERDITAPSVGKVSFTQECSGGTCYTGFTFTVSIPIPGDYSRLSLMQGNVTGEVKGIENPQSGQYSITNLNLPYDMRNQANNWWVWTKKDGTKIIEVLQK